MIYLNTMLKRTAVVALACVTLIGCKGKKNEETTNVTNNKPVSEQKVDINDDNTMNKKPEENNAMNKENGSVKVETHTGNAEGNAAVTNAEATTNAEG